MKLLSDISNQCKTLLSLLLKTHHRVHKQLMAFIKITAKTIINLSSYQLSDKPNQVLTLRFASQLTIQRLYMTRKGVNGQSTNF